MGWPRIARSYFMPVTSLKPVSKLTAGSCILANRWNLRNSHLPSGDFDWTPETRARHNRDHLRFGSDLSDEEWQVIAPFMPPPAETGRRRVWPMREMLNAIFYILRVGCPWRQLPEHFPPHQTTYRLVRPLSRRRFVGEFEPPIGHARPRVCRPRSQSIGRRD
jgi:transposase